VAVGSAWFNVLNPHCVTRAGRVAIPAGAVQYQFQATVESSTCPIQVGLDQYLSTTAVPDWGVTMTELALGDWVVADGCTQTLYTPRPDGVCAAISTTTPPPTPPPTPPTRYLDRDGDGYGTGSPVAGGTATRGGDCDDTRSSVHPGATEVCDSRDNDCDGSTDEGGVCGPVSSRTDLWPSGSLPPLIAIAATDAHIIIDGTADLNGRALSSWSDADLRASFWANGQSWNAVPVSLTRFTVGGRVFFAVPVPTLPSGLTPFPHNQPSCRGARDWPARLNLHSRVDNRRMAIGPLAALGAVWSGLDIRGVKTSSLAVSRVNGRLSLSGAETSWGPCN
jgi:hypothetical protein